MLTNARTRRALPDEAFELMSRGCAVLVFALLAAILCALAFESRETIAKYGLAFLTTADWDPIAEHYGALAPVAGTLVTSAIALAVAVPVSLGIAITLTELAPRWVRRPLATMLELLAAIPSIIYGMWGLFVFAPLFQQYVEPGLTRWLSPIPFLGRLFEGAPYGIGLLTAGLILALMVIPFIASVMREVFEAVPPLLRESSYGIGCTTWETIRHVVLPYGRNGVAGGIMLGLGRALGETMAVTFVIGNAFQMPGSLLDPSVSIASALANGFNEAAGLEKSALIELGLILFLITTAVLAASRWMLRRLEAGEGKK